MKSPRHARFNSRSLLAMESIRSNFSRAGFAISHHRFRGCDACGRSAVAKSARGFASRGNLKKRPVAKSERVVELLGAGRGCRDDAFELAGFADAVAGE